jgi:Zn-finger nucleic acid-binding protein
MAENEMNCPSCGAEMVDRVLSGIHVHQCPDGHGVFLERADLGNLIEAENDWHAGAGHQTMAMPRITAEMTAPPPAVARSRAFVETLFG